MNNMNRAENKFEMSPEALAQLGDGRIAYVKTIRSEDVQTLFPQADVPRMAPGQKLFALHAADGTPIMLTDSREAAVANAWNQELETVSVHSPGTRDQASAIGNSGGPGAAILSRPFKFLSAVSDDWFLIGDSDRYAAEAEGMAKTA